MKQVFIMPVLAIVALTSFPSASHALSCLDPAGMTDYIVSDEQFLVVTATPVEQREYIEEEATQEGLYDSGYTAQFIEVSAAHKGTSPDSDWVYFRRDATWNYLCAGEPPALNSEMLYVINQSDGIFDPQSVVNTYELDSKLAQDLLAALAEAEDEDIVEPSVYEVSSEDWAIRLKDQLKEMAMIVKMKLAEWKFWNGQ